MQKLDLDYFFTLNRAEREVFFPLIDRVSAIITHEKLTPEQMAAKLPQEVFNASEFQKFDARLTTTMVEGILQMLNDDRSIPYLITKLDDYDHRYLAAKIPFYL